MAAPGIADLHAAVDQADEQAPPGTAILILGTTVSWHDQMWATLWSDRLFFYDDWLWYWQREHVGDYDPETEHAYRVDGHSWLKTFMRIAIPLARPGIAAAALLAFIFAWNNFVFALILASADKQPVTVGALAFVTASGIQYGQIAAAVVLSVTPTLLLALYAQRYLVEGLSLGAVKG